MRCIKMRLMTIADNRFCCVKYPGMKGTGNIMNKYLIYLFKFVYELGVFAAVYFLLKYFAESVD